MKSVQEIVALGRKAMETADAVAYYNPGPDYDSGSSRVYALANDLLENPDDKELLLKFLDTAEDTMLAAEAYADWCGTLSGSIELISMFSKAANEIREQKED